MNENKKMPQESKRGFNWITVLIVFFLLTYLFNLFTMHKSSTSAMQISYDQFLDLVEAGAVSQVYMNDDQIQIFLQEDIEVNDVANLLGADELPEGIQDTVALLPKTVTFYTGRANDLELVSVLRASNVRIYEEIPEQTSVFSAIASWILPMAIMYIIYFVVVRMMMKHMGGGEGGFMGGISGIGKSKAKVYSVEQSTGVTFRDVAGQEEAKESLEEMVDYLKNPKKYQDIGAKQPKGPCWSVLPEPTKHFWPKR